MDDRNDSPLTGSHWGLYRAETSGGRVRALRGFEHDADPSPIGQGMLDTQDGPTRITQPMVRQGWLDGGPGSNRAARGADPFVAVSWDEAETLVARELTRVRDQHGNGAIYAGSYGWASAGRFHHAQSQLHRFLNCMGGYVRSENTYSFASGEVLVPHVMGNFYTLLSAATSWPSIIENTRLFVGFGGVPLKNGQINAGGVGRHRQRGYLAAAAAAGVEFVNIGPLRSDLEGFAAAEWLAIRPGTDTALMLALAHTLVVEGLHDPAFLARYTVGFDRFQTYLTGAEGGPARSADWAADICQIPAQSIRTLARRMATSRTMISLAWSLTRADHGEMAYWAGITLAAMLGQIGLPGGGVGFGYSATNSIGNDYGQLPFASFPQGRNPVPDFIPVARISDMLLNPGAAFDYDGGRYRYPDIRLVYWAGGNPFHHHQDLNRLVAAWQRPETIIVNEWCWTATAKRADIVLPCTTVMERADLIASPRDGIIALTSALRPPAGQARDDYDIFRGIARALGIEADFTQGKDQAEWLRTIYAESRKLAAAAGSVLPDYDALCRDGFFEVPDPEAPRIMLDRFRADPQAHPLPTPSGKIEIASARIAGFGYADCPGHACWLEPAEWLGAKDPAFPLHLISNQPQTKLHSQLDHGSHSRASKIQGREPVLLNPADARARNIAAGDVVRLFNARGACLAGAVISADIRPGVVQMTTGAWFDPETPGQIGSLCLHGNPNVLTLDKGTSRLGQGPIAQTCLVEVERLATAPPPLTALDPPAIVQRRALPGATPGNPTRGR